jgi:hypothetical protein
MSPLIVSKGEQYEDQRRGILSPSHYVLPVERCTMLIEKGPSAEFPGAEMQRHLAFPILH